MISSTSRVSQVVQACVNQDTPLHPRIFCRRWFGLDDINIREDGRLRYRENLILAMESEYGYREKCINLLAQILKIKPNTIQRWGRGVEFDNIPKDKQQQYETFLGYVDTLRVLTTNLIVYDEKLAFKLLNKSPKNFNRSFFIRDR
jgi:hypothetical protein